MKERINEKIKEIEDCLEELSEILPESFEEYGNNFEKKAACERYFEKIVEAAIDLAFLVAKEERFSVPETETGIFKILESENIINKSLSENLQDAKSMRNFIIHKYGEINDFLVYEAIKEELEKDIKEFVELIKRKLK